MLHAGLVGQRVVVRRRLPGERGATGGPAMTDLLGTLEWWGRDEIGVRAEDGDLVVIHKALIVSGKAVPARPRRRRPTDG